MVKSHPFRRLCSRAPQCMGTRRTKRVTTLQSKRTSYLRQEQTRRFILCPKAKRPYTSARCMPTWLRSLRYSVLEGYSDRSSLFIALSCHQVGTKFIVCDAGGSTVDTTAYTVKQRPPHLVLEETKASGCKSLLARIKLQVNFISPHGIDRRAGGRDFRE